MKIVGHNLTTKESFYFFEIAKGLWITSRHFIYNMYFHFAHLFGKYPEVPAAVTLQYPEEKIPLSRRWRGRHRINARPDGSPRCVACMLCETVCPVQCIHIVAGEHPDPAIEKYPVSFEIDVTRCCWCGMCEEACPVDALYMDTGKSPEPGFSRDDLLYRKEQLVKEMPLPGCQRSLNAPGQGPMEANPLGL